MDLRQPKKAVDDFDRSIELDPDYAEHYYYRGLCKIELNEHDKAIEDFFKAIDQKSENPGIYNGLGLAFKAKDDFDKALNVSSTGLTFSS